MATTFTKDDARTCFHCSVNRPVFRVISLERFPNESGDLVPDTMAGLFCESCLRLEIESYYDAFEQAKLPFGIRGAYPIGTGELRKTWVFRLSELAAAIDRTHDTASRRPAESERAYHPIIRRSLLK